MSSTVFPSIDLDARLPPPPRQHRRSRSYHGGSTSSLGATGDFRRRFTESNTHGHAAGRRRTLRCGALRCGVLCVSVQRPWCVASGVWKEVAFWW